MRRIALAICLVMLLATSALAFRSSGDIADGLRYRHFEVHSTGKITFDLINKTDNFMRLSGYILFCERDNDVVAESAYIFAEIPPDSKRKVESWLTQGNENTAEDASKLIWRR